ncbi:hypothetical protein [Rhodococcoides kroppenstedtii]|uniref:hypothetical protein n=1 Tax=Rhodococcoides kroppenstedtii TaxID=293050 RepID=UPI001BDE1570|nr:hypothetical protein [Rhodococcus kroppenstedtii]MBT1193231.1 hypothetical protein [Rhodococcus kroppenstedtii]
MDVEQQTADELTRIAHSAADALSNEARDGRQLIVLIEPALNSVSDPVRAAVVEREWLRTCWTPESQMDQIPDSFRACRIDVGDMVAHLGPRWLDVIDALATLVGSDFPRWVDSLYPSVDTEAMRSRVGAYAIEIERLAVSAGLQAEFENAVMLPQIIIQHNGGLYLAAHRDDADPGLASAKNGQAFLLMVEAVAGAFEASLNRQ